MHTDPTVVDATILGATPPPAEPERPTRRRHLIAGAAALALVFGIAALVVTPGSSDRSRPAADAAAADGLSAPDGSTATSSTTVEPVGADAVAVGPQGAAPDATGLLAFSPALLVLDAETDDGTFTLRNDGAAAAGWSTDPAPAPWVGVAPSAGTLDPGEAVEVTVTVDRHDLGNGTHDIALVLDSDVPFQQALQTVELSVTVEKAVVEQVAAGPQVICALQSPGAGPKVAVVIATGQHLTKADTIQAGFDTPGPNVFKGMDHDEANDRFITSYTSTVLGAHVVSVEAFGADAVGGAVGAVPINVIWCA